MLEIDPTDKSGTYLVGDVPPGGDMKQVRLIDLVMANDSNEHPVVTSVSAGLSYKLRVEVKNKDGVPVITTSAPSPSSASSVHSTLH